MRRHRAYMVAALLLLLGLEGCGRQPVQPDEDVGTAENWTAPGGGADESGYSRLTQIDTGNVDHLGLAWRLDLPDEVTL